MTNVEFTWMPVHLTGGFKDHDMSHKQFVCIVMPSGIINHKNQVEYRLKTG